MSDPRCDICRFWQDHEENNGRGECRRRAPKPNGDPSFSTEWPNTFASDWCGECEPKRDAEASR